MTANFNAQASNQLFALGKNNKREFFSGEVVLIGAGPGDAELLTVRAYRLIQQADVVVYDRLVSQEIMDLVKRDAELIYVGKKSANHALPQPEINQLLIDQAKQGKKVARLKGGDPFIFGRGGEEIQDLLQAGVPCRVVPGITAASGCTTYSGIPLTHRDFVHGCTFITGHFKNDELDLPWKALAREDHTLVVYMGIKTTPVLAKALMDNGLASDTPVALVSNGTSDDHQSHRTNLSELAEFVKNNHIKPPTLIIVGRVVNALNEELANNDVSLEIEEACL